MLQIAKNEINSFNGLAGDGETGTAAAQTGGTSNNGWQTAQNMIDSTSNLINAGTNFVDSLHNNNNSSSNGTNYPPYNYNWGVTTAPQKQTDYLPWILGGLGVVLLGVVMFNKK